MLAKDLAESLLGVVLLCTGTCCSLVARGHRCSPLLLDLQAGCFERPGVLLALVLGGRMDRRRCYPIQPSPRAAASCLVSGPKLTATLDK